MITADVVADGTRERDGAPGAAAGGVVRAFTSLVLAQVVSAALGYLFWLVIARGMKPDELAVAHASITVMAALGILGSLGYGTLLVTVLPGHPPPTRSVIIRHSLVVVSACGLLLGVLWCLLAPGFASTFARGVNDPLAAGMLAVGVAATAAGSVLDQAVVGLGRAGLQVQRNAIASIVKFPLMYVLILCGQHSHVAALTAWVIPLVLSVFGVWRRIRQRSSETAETRLRAHLRSSLRAALLNHLLNLSLAASSLLLPLIAAAEISADDYASFSVAWLVAGFVFTPAFMLAIALFATTVGDESAYWRVARRTLPAGLALGLACYLGAALLAHPIMATFGSRFVSEGARLLRIVALGVAAMVVKDHFFALYRVRNKVARAAQLGVLGLLLELGGAAAGGSYAGASGLCVGWLIALFLQAGVMVPTVARRLRHSKAESASQRRTDGDSGSTGQGRATSSPPGGPTGAGE